MLALISDHMESGFLENIADMFRHDRSLWRLLPGLISDERTRVRLGAVALVEVLLAEQREEALAAVPSVAACLVHPSRLVRADSAYLMGVIGGVEAIRFLEAALEGEEDPQVREVLEGTIAELRADEAPGGGAAGV